MRASSPTITSPAQTATCSASTVALLPAKAEDLQSTRNTALSQIPKARNTLQSVSTGGDYAAAMSSGADSNHSQANVEDHASWSRGSNSNAGAALSTLDCSVAEPGATLQLGPDQQPKPISADAKGLHMLPEVRFLQGHGAFTACYCALKLQLSYASFAFAFCMPHDSCAG